MTLSRRIVVLIGLTIALIVPVLGPTRFLPTVSGYDPLYVREWLWWALLVLVLLYVLIVERRPLSSVGFKPPTWKTFVFGAAAGVLASLGVGLILAFVFPILHLKMNMAMLGKLLETPLWFRVLLVTRAAFMEETLFRGYGFERLNEYAASRWAAAIVTWAAFTFAHLTGWGWPELVVAGWGGLVLTALYMWRRDLLCNITAHWVADAIGFLAPHG
jgi:membrane protease YdiL (CAAX protease family)